MFNKETLVALQEGASIDKAGIALAMSEDTKEVVALPSDFKLHNLEQFLPNRRRARGTMSTAVLASFTEYATEHAEEGASVFIEPDLMIATAVLNLGSPSVPGHADNRAKLQLKKTAAYSELVNCAMDLAISNLWSPSFWKTGQNTFVASTTQASFHKAKPLPPFAS